MNKLILTSALIVFSQVSMAAESQKPEAQAVNSACAQEATTAGCSSEKVGTGLLKCLHNYKREHKKEFKFSDSCKMAMKTLKESKKR